jgi:hypothetical protein
MVGLVLALVVSTGRTDAQQSIDTGSVSGRIVDGSGAVVPGATVSARHTATNVEDVATSGPDGRFRFPSLRVGAYELSVSLPGFQTVTQRLTLSAGSAFEVPVSLAVGGIDTRVDVTTSAPVLESARSQRAVTMFDTEIEALPLNGRNFLDVALLAPGVAPANIASTQLFPETSAVPGVTLSVSGQRNLSNSIVVDGVSANDDAAGLSGITYGLDAIDQFQVVTSGGQAELGRALGGFASVVTRSGGNVRRGTAYAFFRDDRLNAPNALSGTRLPMSQQQVGASLGGPVVANRTFYFTNIERRNLDQSGLVTVDPVSVDAINARLDAVGYRGPRIATGLYENPVDTTNVFARVDHHLRVGSHLGIRYSLYDVDALNSRGAGGLNVATASSNLDNRDQAVALSHMATLGDRTVIETRAQLAHSHLDALPSDPVGPAVTIAGVATFGRSSSSPEGRVNRLYQVVSNVSRQAGAHALKAGVDVLYNETVVTFPRTVNGAYTFSSLANFLQGIYNNAGYSQTFGVQAVSQRNPNLGVYAQDEWKVGDAVTVNLGLRYELQWLETIKTDTNNLSPRFGVAWTPTASRRTVVRASGGVFYDRVPLRALANALLSAGNTTDVSQLRQIGVSLSPAQAGAPVFPATLDAVVPTVTLANLTTMDRNLQNARSYQASAEVEHQIGDRTTVSAGWQWLRGDHLLMSVNQNVPTCVAAGNNNGCRPNPAYANNNQYSSVGESRHRGLHVALAQRPMRWGSYRVSYALAKTEDNVGQFFFSSPIDPLDLSKDWGRSDNDRRHTLVVSGTVQTSAAPAVTKWQRLTHGFQLGVLLQAYSAAPFNITSGVTTVQGTTGRPVMDGAFIPRNAGDGSAFVTLNLRLTRTVPLPGAAVELFAEAFNVTNRMNVLTRNANFGTGVYPASPSPAFGQVTSVGDPRALQLGARLRF